MIQFNTEYTFSKGKGKISFRKTNDNTISADYTVFDDEGTLTGRLSGDVLEAVFHSISLNKVGLINFTFGDIGFKAEWKKGLEPGAMRGTWETEDYTSSTTVSKAAVVPNTGKDLSSVTYWSWAEIANAAGVIDPLGNEVVSYKPEDMQDYEDVLFEIIEDSTIKGQKVNIKTADLINLAGMFYGCMATHTEHTKWCSKWGMFNEVVNMTVSLNFAECLALGQQYHNKYQPIAPDSYKYEYPKRWFELGFEAVEKAEDCLDLVNYGLFSEYYNYEDMAKQALEKAWALEPTLNIAAEIIADANEERRTYLDEDFFQNVIETAKGLEYIEGYWNKDRFEALINGFE